MQQGDVKTAARHGDTFDACPLVRRVDRLDARQLAGGLKHCGVDGEQCPLRVCLPVHLPRLAKGEEQAAGIKTGEVCRLLQRQARQFAVRADHVECPCEKRQRLVNERDCILAGIHHARPDANVLMAPLEDRCGLGQRRAAFPALGHARVAGLCQRSLAPIGADQQRVAVQPRHAGLGLRQREAALDKALGHHVKLAMHRGILAAA